MGGGVFTMMNIEEDQNKDQQVNPWISVWLHPRKTVRYVTEYKTEKFILLIAMISGVFLSLDMAVNDNFLASWNTTHIALFSLIVGPIIGILGFYFITAIYHLFSKMLGGEGTSEQTRMAFAVSEIIIIIVGPLLILDLLIVGQNKHSQSTWLVISTIINSIAGIWSTVAFIGAISEVHRFSIWKAIFVAFVPILFLILISIIFFGLPFFF